MDPVAKRESADLLGFTVPKIAEIVTGRKNFKTAAKNVRRQTLTKQLGCGSRKKTAGRFIPTSSVKKNQSVERSSFYKPF